MSIPASKFHAISLCQGLYYVQIMELVHNMFYVLYNINTIGLKKKTNRCYIQDTPSILNPHNTDLG